MKKIISLTIMLVLVFGLMACTDTEDDETINFEPGKYNGTAEAHNGTLEVEVEFSENEILAINIVNSNETEHLAEPVYEYIPNKVIEEQSLNVDSVSGATITSIALKNAIADAVVKAEGDPEVLKKSLEEDAKTEIIDLESDVVVVGAGAAGLSAALSAEQNGLSVILLEKNMMVGGHTALSGGYTLITGSELQERLGVTNDTPEKAYEDMMINGGEESVPELLSVFSNNMGAAADWTIDYVGAEAPDELTSLAENSIDRALIYKGAGAGLINAFSNKLEETSVDLYLDTEATTLLTDGNEVIGVIAKSKDGTEYHINAEATVLATGGYAANKELLPESLDNYVYYGASLSKGDGLIMGQEVGADTVNMGYVELFPNGVEWKPGIAKSTYNGSMAAWNGSAILVDPNGKRVVNERGDGNAIVDQQSAQPEDMLWMLMDQATFDIFSDNIGGTGISQEMLDSWVENNGQEAPLFINGETIEEIAEIAGVEIEGLEKTIEEYNQYVENGEDEDFGRPAQYLSEKIDEGPYYLVEQRPRYATTLGGLLIDSDFKVVATNGELVKGLYSIGDTAGGARGDSSIPGADVAWAITSGYLMGDILEEMLEDIN